MKKSQAISRITQRVGDNSTFWGPTEKGYALNEALSVWQALTGAYIVSQPFFFNYNTGTNASGGTGLNLGADPIAVDRLIVADTGSQMAEDIFSGSEPNYPASPVVDISYKQRYFSTPKQIVSLQRVKFAGVVLKQTSLWELDTLNPGWDSGAAGTPTRWAPVGINLFVVDPAPGYTGLFETFGIGQAARVQGADEIILINDDVVNKLLAYTQLYLSFKEGSQELQNAQPFLKDLVEAAGRVTSQSKAVALFREFMGLDRQQRQQPLEAGEKSPGIR